MSDNAVKTRYRLLMPVTLNCVKLGVLTAMKLLFSLGVAHLSAVLITAPATANTCAAKKIKVKAVCGIVVDGSGAPIRDATLQLVSVNGEVLSHPASTQSDGRFLIEHPPRGDAFLRTSAPQHNTGRWPLKVTDKAPAGQCKKPLVVHLAGCLGCGCGDWVDQKLITHP